MTIKYRLLLCLLVLFKPAFTQTVITGIVVDAYSKIPLSYVNIGIKNKNIGTSSLHNGTFTLNIPEQNINDTLTLSIVGYSELNLSIKNVIATNQQIFLLTIKTTELNTVNITYNALEEKKFGIKKDNTLIKFTDGSTNQNDIFEIAQLVKFDTLPSKITSVNLLIGNARKDSATFRINLYRHDENGPGDRIVEKSIIQTKAIVPGWLKFDLKDYNIKIKGDFVVAIEFIPAPQKTEPIYYEVKLGGLTKSYVRANSLGLWSRPPHHYKMHITALVENSKNKNSHKIDSDDEVETAPTVNLYSKSVNDTFSIFVNLPETYSTKKNKSFNVVYLLDANAYFDIIADEIRKAKKQIILIGIGYENAYLMDSLRNRDYTYPTASVRDSFSISGGAKQFYSFLTTELIPYIDKTYQTTTGNRTLMGHSLGGYFTLFALEQSLGNQRNFFNNYVSASPSLHYGDQYLIKRFHEIPAQKDNSLKLLMTIGGNELQEDKTVPENFNSLIHGLNDKHINLTTITFPSFGHMDTALPTFIKGINHIE